MKCFILEDDPQRMSGFLKVPGLDICWRDNFEAAKVAYEEHKPFDVLLLDHDLCDEHYIGKRLEENTGYHFAKWLAEEQDPNDATYVIIHSYNPDGALMMEHILAKAGWNAHRMPFGTGLLDWLRGAVTPPASDQSAVSPSPPEDLP